MKLPFEIFTEAEEHFEKFLQWQYELGIEFDANWQWKFNIKTPCGDHLVDSLRVMHRLINDHMDPDYKNK